jgi:hypothetical protein
VRAPTPLEVCKQIAAEHAAGTLAALEKERAAKLAARLADYGQKLGELTAEKRERDQTDAAFGRTQGSRRVPGPGRSLAG